jgi:hypothetical protein
MNVTFGGRECQSLLGWLFIILNHPSKYAEIYFSNVLGKEETWKHNLSDDIRWKPCKVKKNVTRKKQGKKFVEKFSFQRKFFFTLLMFKGMMFSASSRVGGKVWLEHMTK